jgi:hypothetical protein
MEIGSAPASPIDRLFDQNRFHVDEFNRWVKLGRIGRCRLLNYFQVNPPTPDVAYIAYEIVAECRHDVATPSDSQDVELALHEIRLHLRPRQKV